MLGEIIKLVLTVIVVLVIVGVIASNIRIVPQAHCYIVERLGVYYTTWQAGLRFKIPFIDRVASRISLKEQVLDFPPQSVITKDNVTMNIDSVVYARVFDPKKYTYGVENPIVGLQNLTATTLRSVIGEMDLDETLSSREQINAKMRVILDEATDEWGIQVTRVEVKNITPPREIEEVMTKQMRAERERRQTVLEAQAHQESVVARAKGDKEAKVLAAEAERDRQFKEMQREIAVMSSVNTYMDTLEMSKEVAQQYAEARADGDGDKENEILRQHMKTLKSKMMQEFLAERGEVNAGHGDSHESKAVELMKSLPTYSTEVDESVLKQYM